MDFFLFDGGGDRSQPVSPKFPKNAVRIHRAPTSLISALTARLQGILLQRDFSTRITQGSHFLWSGS